MILGKCINLKKKPIKISPKLLHDGSTSNKLETLPHLNPWWFVLHSVLCLWSQYLHSTTIAFWSAGVNMFGACMQNEKKCTCHGVYYIAHALKHAEYEILIYTKDIFHKYLNVFIKVNRIH